MAFRSLETIVDTGTLDEALMQAGAGAAVGSILGSPLGMLAMFGVVFLTKDGKWGQRAGLVIILAAMVSGAGLGFFTEVPTK